MTAPRVFVRAVGAVTPLGSSWTATWDALVAGACAISPVKHFDVAGFPSQVAASIVDRPGGEEPWGAEDRRLPLARTAADEAWQRATLEVPSHRLGVFVGAESARPPFATVVALAKRAVRGDGHDGCSASDSRARAAVAAMGSLEGTVAVSPAAVAARLAGRIRAHGPVQTICLACASSAVAIAEGARAIEQGRCDAVLCGGVGADVDPFMLAGFGLLGALSATGRSRPFDAARDGFVLGEAAVFVVLAREPGATSVELLGTGRSLDAHHITSPDPTGRGAEQAMRAALAGAHLDAVDLVQAHGTATLLNDAVEAAALRRVFARGPAPRVSAVKGALGHTIAAAGALGFACAASAIEQGVVNPTVGLERPDVDCELDHVLGAAARLDVRTAMVNAFAFGGANCSIVLGRA